MKVIVIGSKGFIGQHLLAYLQGRGHECWGADVVVDYIQTGRYFLIDAVHSDFRSVFESEEYDLCINCSGAASVPDSLKHPLRDFHLNVVNVFMLLEAIRRYQPECRFLNLSSAAVYGNPPGLPVKESTVTAPLSPYGIHKLQSEQVCKEFTTFYNIRTCSLRIFSVFGPGLQKQLFWDLYKKARSGKELILYGTGNESRDYIHVHDLVRVIELVSEQSNFQHDILNVANGREVKIKDAVSIFFSFIDPKIRYNFSGNIRKGDPVNWKADIGNLKTFGYSPTISLEEGLEGYVQWVKKTWPDSVPE